MNQAYKKLSTFIFAAIVTTSAYGMESENVVEVSTEEVAPAIWYKKGSVQAAAAVTVALAGYALAVHMGKVSVPACITAKSLEQLVVNENQDHIINHVVEVSKSEMPADWLKGMLHFFENAINNLTEEDLKQIHEECSR
jgi:hypothetical protein